MPITPHLPPPAKRFTFILLVAAMLSEPSSAAAVEVVVDADKVLSSVERKPGGFVTN